MSPAREPCPTILFERERERERDGPVYNMSLVVRKPVLGGGVPTRSDTNQAVQPHKMARGLKFRI